MDRVQCEKEILKHMAEIARIYNEYKPKGRYLTMCYMRYTDDDGQMETSLSVNNDYAKRDRKKPLNATLYGRYGAGGDAKIKRELDMFGGTTWNIYGGEV